MMTVLNDGTVTAEALVLETPVSFWGGFDPVTGKILESGHPQRGHEISGKVLVMPYAKGSSGTPAGVAESIRVGTGPAAIVLGKPDANIAVGAKVAAQLYGINIPVIVVTLEHYMVIQTGQQWHVDTQQGLLNHATA